ncbi:Hypothetical Protein RradSPS_1882 [Rubrobacter radiotolerans]|uniref:Uncharacterized protein n=1 Tax=Rubrobacter radiotolerans TaxID=42256 RepID=A0A023X594_RUBRA|nr:hypothetical protein [Rubrobacter radiotolerans]AHY47165.1 Hypothetical Protein RradSPS_1882 [Rubrobacter radiotolerans]MDX5894570.1 hypothetical protein [Rubrobacter radiotolerans]SMC06286.1 hypothetical protein SAMN00767673_1884 [Rubrobacter radiotolerans DSM 5868]
MTSLIGRAGKRTVAGVVISGGLLLGGALVYTQPVEAQGAGDVPYYEVVDSAGAAGVQSLSVVTDAEREGDLRLIADELRDEENVPEGGTLLVEYYAEDDPSEDTGFALVFDTEEAVLDAGLSERYGQTYSAEDAERIIEEEDGIRVVSYRDFSEENGGLWERIKSFLL